MGAINAYSGDEFPVAQSTIEPDLDASDCVNFDTFEELVTELQLASGTACTIRNGRAYALSNPTTLTGICTP
jgi:hypothetical protein